MFALTFIIFNYLAFIYLVFGGGHIPWCGGQETTYESWFPSSIIQVPGSDSGHRAVGVVTH